MTAITLFTKREQMVDLIAQLDPWIASSLVQKAIRRGEAETASQAALRLLALRGAGVFRRLLVVAFEDVGAAAPDVVAEAATACTDTEFRRRSGGNATVAEAIARLLANAVKDRSADHLICAARSHPDLAEARQQMERLSAVARIEVAMNSSASLPERAVATWYASGVEWGDERRVGPGDLPMLLAAFRDQGAPDALLEATRLGAARTREPITIMVPLIWLAIAVGPKPTVINCEVPKSPTIAGVPLYALDTHTRVGRRAIDTFIKDNEAVRACLDQHAPPRSRRETGYVCAFYADGAPVSPKLNWSQAEALDALGIETDLILTGVAPDGMAALSAVFRENLDHLNTIRAKLFNASRAAGVTGASP